MNTTPDTFSAGTRVRHVRTGLVGTVIRDADNGTVPVLYDNGTRAAVLPVDLVTAFTIGQSLTWGDEVVSFRRYLDGPWQGTHAEIFTSRGSANVRVSELSAIPEIQLQDTVEVTVAGGTVYRGIVTGRDLDTDGTVIGYNVWIPGRNRWHNVGAHRVRALPDTRSRTTWVEGSGTHHTVLCTVHGLVTVLTTREGADVARIEHLRTEHARRRTQSELNQL